MSCENGFKFGQKCVSEHSGTAKLRKSCSFCNRLKAFCLVAKNIPFEAWILAEARCSLSNVLLKNTFRRDGRRAYEMSARAAVFATSNIGRRAGMLFRLMLCVAILAGGGISWQVRKVARLQGCNLANLQDVGDLAAEVAHCGFDRCLLIVVLREPDFILRNNANRDF